MGEIGTRAVTGAPGCGRSAMRIAAVALVCIALGACGGRVRGVLVPNGGTPVDGASPVTMLVATTRAPDERNPGELFSGERAPTMSFAQITVSVPPDAGRTIGDVQWPSRLPGDPAREFVTSEVRKIPESGTREALRRALVRSRDGHVLVFVHGFNNRFEEAVYRFAQIVHDSGARAAPVLFTWPSRGSLFAYYYDRESANYSRDALERVLASLARNPQVREVSVMAHSMGNWLTLETLRQMAIRNGRVPAKIRNVMLAAPDVDTGVFVTQMSQMGATRPNFTLFVSQDDRALALSRRLAGGINRLGAIDPEQEPFRTQLAQNRITVLDLTKLRAGDSTNHNKFAASPEVVRFIGQRLVDGQRINDNETGLGHRLGEIATGAVSAVGSAAGLAIAAPIAVFDPATREQFGDRLQRFGETTADTVTGGLIEPGAGPASPEAATAANERTRTAQ